MVWHNCLKANTTYWIDAFLGRKVFELGFSWAELILAWVQGFQSESHQLR